MMPEGPPTGGRAHRDLERYAGLFASRTRVMKSSAMRDLMAITERPEVISLAGGLPDTSTFPAERLPGALPPAPPQHVPRRAARGDPQSRRRGEQRAGAPVRAHRGHARRRGMHRAGHGS